jgi:hypothetical protein
VVRWLALRAPCILLRASAVVSAAAISATCLVSGWYRSIISAPNGVGVAPPAPVLVTAGNQPEGSFAIGSPTVS